MELQKINKQDFLKRFLSLTGEGVFAVNSELKVSFVNVKMAEMTGLATNDIIGCPAEEIFSDKSQFAEICETLKTAKTLQQEIKFLRKEGGAFFASASISQVSGKKSEAIIFLVTDITRQKLEEARLKEKLHEWQMIMDHLPDPIFIQDKDYRVVRANKAFFSMLSLQENEVVGKKCFEIFHKTSYPWPNCPFEKTRIDKKTHVEEIFDPKIGKILEITTSPIFTESGEFFGSLHLAKNITEHADEKKKLKTLNRTLLALSNSNQLLIKAADEVSYLKDVCKIVTEACGHKMVWVGYAKDDKEKSIIPVAYAGFEEGYIETLNLTWADRERGNGPTGRAIREGKIALCQDMQTDPKFLPWRAEALKRGYASSISLPLTEKGIVFGAITIYSPAPNAFSEEEINLLKELAGGLSYSIISIRARESREKAERLLRQSEAVLLKEKQTFSVIMQNTKTSLAYLDRDFNFIAISAEYCKNNGRSEEELLGKNYFDFFPGEETLVLFEKVRDSGGQIDLVQKPLINKNQPWREVSYWDWTITPAKNNENYVYGLVIAQNNVSERVKSIENLKLHSQRLEQAAFDLKKVQTAVENASDIVFITDEKGRIIYINKAVKTILGFKQKELIGRRPNFWMENMPNKFFSQMWNSIYFNKKPFTGEIQDRKKDGDIFTAEVRIAPVLDKNGQILSFVGIERDITESKRLDAAKTEFISLAAHQLRTPITNINLTAEMLLSGISGSLGKDADEYLKSIMHNIKKMGEMIELFLNVSRIEMKTFKITPRPTNMLQIIEENLKMVEPLAKNKNLEIRKKMPEFLPLCTVDPKAVNIALENLLTNAIKYTPEGGVISVSAENFRGSITIKVSDTGCGIPKKQQLKIFEKLYRADNVDTKTEGIGLGLYLSKSLVEQSGGKIWVVSEKNMGSSFFVSFPLSPKNFPAGNKNKFTQKQP